MFFQNYLKFNNIFSKKIKTCVDVIDMCGNNGVKQSLRWRLMSTDNCGPVDLETLKSGIINMHAYFVDL